MARMRVRSGPGVFELVEELKASPERLDKDLRATLRRIAVPVRDDARTLMRAAHPVAKVQRKGRRGEYRWSQVVNAITSSANSDTPQLKLDDDRKGGIGGWEFGSKKYPQFGKWTPMGRAFFPAIRRNMPMIEEEVAKAADFYFELHFNRKLSA